MKAYMSIPGARVVCCVSPTRDGQHAEAEAQMLLGERVGHAIEASFSTPTRAYMNHQDETANALFALQEALAAFCDDGQEC